MRARIPSVGRKLCPQEAGMGAGGGGAARSEADSKWWTLGTMRKWEGGPGEEEEETQPAQNFSSGLQPLQAGARHSRRNTSDQ